MTFRSRAGPNWDSRFVCVVEVEVSWFLALAGEWGVGWWGPIVVIAHVSWCKNNKNR